MHLLAFTAAEWVQMIIAIGIALLPVFGAQVVLAIKAWRQNEQQMQKLDSVRKDVSEVKQEAKFQTEVAEATNVAIGEQMKIKAAQMQLVANKSNNPKDQDIADMAQKAVTTNINETESRNLSNDKH